MTQCNRADNPSIADLLHLQQQAASLRIHFQHLMQIRQFTRKRHIDHRPSDR
jgi:hypothetical protein